MHDTPNPFSETDAGDADDQELTRRIQAGSRDALEGLLARHQPWIYNLALRMLWHPQNAEDATQEILIKVLTRISTFQGRSSVRTWLYRIAINHLLNVKRNTRSAEPLTFERYGRLLDATVDADLPDPSAVPADVQLLVREAEIGCTSGMLLCLDAEQRLVYILGAIFGITDVVGAELLEGSRENYRQRLARARRDLHRFMQGQCGLIDKANPCRCERKTQGFIKAGYLNPGNLLFAAQRLARVRDVAPQVRDDLEALDAAYAEIHRGHPFHQPPDLAASIRRLIERPDIRSLLELK